MRKYRIYTSVFIVIICLVFTGYLLAERKKKLSREYNVANFRELETLIKIDGAKIKIRGGSPDEFKSWIYYNSDEFDADIYMNKDRERTYVTVNKRGFFKKFSYNSSVSPEVFVELPSNVPVLFRSKIFAGDVDIDLGNVMLRDLKLELTAGDFEIFFGTPNQDKIDKLFMDLDFGEINIRRLGNANFRYAKIDAAAGDLRVDLSGEYRQDTEIELDLEIGSTTVYLPRNIGVKLDISKWWFLAHINELPYNLRKEGRYYYSSNYNTTQYKTFIKINAGIGEINVRWE